MFADLSNRSLRVLQGCASVHSRSPELMPALRDMSYIVGGAIALWFVIMIIFLQILDGNDLQQMRSMPPSLPPPTQLSAAAEAANPEHVLF